VLITQADSAALLSLGVHFMASASATSPPLLPHVVVFVWDEPSLAVCLEAHDLCLLDDQATAAEQVDFSAEKLSKNSRAWYRIGWRKVELIQDVLNEGYTVFWVDLDVFWVQSPLVHPGVLPAVGHADVAFSTDGKPSPVAELSSHKHSDANIGLLLLRPTQRARDFLASWLARNDSPALRDQYVFIHTLAGALAGGRITAAPWDFEGVLPNFCAKLTDGLGYCKEAEVAEIYCRKKAIAARVGEGNALHGWVAVHLACSGNVATKTVRVVDLANPLLGVGTEQASPGITCLSFWLFRALGGYSSI